MKEYRIAAIPGDGIGNEVIEAGIRVLDALQEREGGFRLAIDTFPWGSQHSLEHGCIMPDDGLQTLKNYDAIYFGSAGDPRIPDHITGADSHFMYGHPPLVKPPAEAAPQSSALEIPQRMRR